MGTNKKLLTGGNMKLKKGDSVVVLDAYADIKHDCAKRGAIGKIIKVDESKTPIKVRFDKETIKNNMAEDVGWFDADQLGLITECNK